MVCQLRTILIVGLLCIIAALFAGCAAHASSGSTASPSETPTATPSETPSATPSATPDPTSSYPTEPPMKRVGTDELPAQRAKWNAAGIASYRYTVTLGCFCFFSDTNPFTVTVRDGQIAEFIDANGKSIPPGESFDSLKGLATVEKLFERAGATASSNDHSVTLNFDPTYGHPTEISTSGRAFVADDELTISITGFAVLPQTTPVVLPKTGGAK